jgi:pyridoxine 4-dehydrogenase
MTPVTTRFGDHEPLFRIGFGAMRLLGDGAWGPPPDLPAALKLLRRAADLGVGLFDTADIYGPGISEELIAQALYPYPSDLIIATKGGLRKTAPGLVLHAGSPSHLKAACEESLRALRLETIPLYQLHAVDPDIPIEESMGAFVDLQKEGKIRHIGVCNVTVNQFNNARRFANIVSVQNRFSVLEQQAADVLAVCEQSGVLFLPWFPLAGGALAQRNGILHQLAEMHRATPAQIAIAWLLYLSEAILPIPGTRSLKHLEDNIGCAAIQLSEAEVKLLTDTTARERN